MKSVIFMAVVCLAANALADPLAALEFCKQQENITDEELSPLNNFENSYITPTLKHFLACYYEKLGYLKDDIVQEDIILKDYKDARDKRFMKYFVEKCKDTKGNDHLDTVYKFFMCFQEVKYEFH